MTDFVVVGIVMIIITILIVIFNTMSYQSNLNIFYKVYTFLNNIIFVILYRVLFYRIKNNIILNKVLVFELVLYNG